MSGMGPHERPDELRPGEPSSTQTFVPHAAFSYTRHRSSRMAKSKLGGFGTQNVEGDPKPHMYKPEIDVPTLPEPTIWARAVLLGTAVLGVTMIDRTLHAKNVELFGQLVRDAVLPLGPLAWAFMQVLETRLKGIGVTADCDRLRTARSANALCESLANTSAPVIIELLANARLDTSSSAVQASLANATSSLTTLEDPIVVSTLKRLAQMERSDLSASKYLREARTILQQDEMRRSLQVELRMVIGAAEAYLSTGKQSMLGVSAFEETRDFDFNTPAPPQVMPKIVAPVAVVIGKKKSTAPPPPSTQLPKKELVNKNTDTKTLVSPDDFAGRGEDHETLASESAQPLMRVNIERRGMGLNRAAARELLDEAYKEALDKLNGSKGPMLVSVVLTCDVVPEA